MKYLRLSLNILLALALAFFTVLMVRITLPYLSLEDNIGFLRIKRSVNEIPIWKVAFYVHVFSSTFLLLAGFSQFSRYILQKQRNLHRLAGRAYVAIILLLSGPAGLIMSVVANGGIPSQIAFTMLSLLWIFFTWKAYRTAKNGDLEAHGEFMLRSFALTLSALTLRAWKLVLVWLFRPNPMDLYMLVAWLGWVPNFIIAELLILGKLHLRLLKRVKPKNQ